MKKTLNRLSCLMLSGICAVGTFGLVGCGKSGGTIDIDDTKTQLYVGLIENGYGSTWLDAAIAKFEAKYDGVSLEDGKSGLQIVVDMMSDYGGNLQAKLKNTRSEIIFDGDMDYYSYVVAGDMVDISDVVQGKLTAYGEDKSIEDKMDVNSRNAFKINGKYYALPFTYSNFGITYNKDMFNENGFYFAANDPDHGDYSVKKEGSNFAFISRNNTVKSAGPDGKTGVIDGVDYSVDDGLPQTYEQFFALCDYIFGKGKIPLSWAGSDAMQNYLNQFLAALWANIEGADQMELNYSMNGTATDLISVDGNGAVTPIANTAITEKNGNELYKQRGRYYALKFLETIVKNPNYYFGNTNSHTQAQDYFIRSGINSGYKEITMFIEGSYWENEARATFAQMARNDEKYSRVNRNFGWMPLPQVSESDIGRSGVLVPATTNLVFLNPHRLNGSFKMDVAKEFLKLLHTRENLAAFTVETSLYKPYFDYELNATELAAMSNLGREIYNFSRNAEMVDVSPCKVVLANYGTFHIDKANLWYSKAVANGTFPVSELKKESVRAEGYFNGIYEYYNNTQWKTLYENAYGSGSFDA